MAFPFARRTVTVAPATVDTMQDVWDFLAVEGPTYLLQAMRTLATHTNHAPPSSQDATFEWIAEHFPKARRGVHPRPELDQGLDAYKKWRADLVRAVTIASGARAARQARDARQDGWTDLLSAVRLHTRDGGLIHPATASAMTTFADIARRASLEPWDLDTEGATTRLEAALPIKEDRKILRTGLAFLATYGFIPEIACLLPQGPLPTLPALRDHDTLPAHVDALLVEMVDKAAVQRDEVSGKDSRSVADSTRDRYLAALRHHVRALPHCPANPDLDYLRPVRDLASVNDVADLFALDHLKASIRRTEAVEHLPGTLSQASAYCYYGDILVVLSRNGLSSDEIYRSLKTSKFLKEGRELAEGMRPATKAWCSLLLSDPDRERRFRNMHRILQAKADAIFDAARAEGRDPFDDSCEDLTASELARVRALGTAAAAAAIELAGRPIRMGNVLNLRLLGSRANFHTPGRHRPAYSFFLTAAETKTGKEEPPAPLRKELFGPQVLAWYLNKIRPLFPHAAKNIHLFPAVESPDLPLSKNTFDAWFQRAASEAGIPMTFHRWRHGYASLLLAQSWSNLQVAADMLGNTPAVCAKSYAWINKQKIYSHGQDIMIARARGHK